MVALRGRCRRPDLDAFALAPSTGASQIWGGNSLAGNQCQRWLALLAVFGRDAVQAPGLAVRWRPSVGEGARTGTGPAPAGI